MLLTDVGLEHRAGAERQQPDHRTDLQPEGLAAGQPQDVVVEAVLLVPHVVRLVAGLVHRVGDPDEVLEELEGHLLVHRVVIGEDDRYLEHVLAVERHPRRAVRLFQRTARGQLGAAVEYADVVQAQEAAGENVAALRVLAVHPPVEVEHQALKRALQERDVLPAEVLLDFVEEERRPRVHRGVHVAEVPLIGGHLPIGVAVQAAEHEQELLLGEVEVDQRQRQRVERQVPRRVPGVLPLVGHGDDVAVQHVEPLGVPDRARLAARERMCVVLLQPPVQVEVVELLRPEHAGERLAVYAALVLAERARRDPVVELVGIEDPLAEGVLEVGAERLARRAGGQAKPDGLAASGRHVDDVAGRRLGAGLRGVHGALLARDHVAVERVLHVRRRVGRTPQPFVVRLVLGEEQFRRAVARERVVAEFWMGRDHRSASLTQDRLRVVISPRPGVPEPQRRQQVQPGGLGAAIVDRHPDEDVVRPGLGVFDEHVEVPVIVEDPRVDQFVLEFLPRAPLVRLHEVPVGVLPLRVLVDLLHVRVGGRRVDVEVVLLDVLAVVSLAVGEPEHPLLQDRDPGRSTARARNRGAGHRPKSPRGRPRPTGRPGNGPDRA